MKHQNKIRQLTTEGKIFKKVIVLVTLLGGSILISLIFHTPAHIGYEKKQENISTPTRATSQYGAIQTQITPYLSPIDSTRNRFVYPDQSVSFEIPTNAKIDITETRYSSSTSDKNYLVGMKVWDNLENVPYQIRFFDSGLDAFRGEYEWQDLYLAGMSVHREVYYKDNGPSVILYWPNQIGGFGKTIIMVGVEQVGFKKGDSFSFADNLINSMKVLKKAPTPTQKP